MSEKIERKLKFEPVKETEREIDQHLNYLWEKIENESAYRSGRAASRDEIKKIQEEQESKEALIKKAKKQLKDGQAGEEILHLILDFQTPKGKEAEDNLNMIKKLLKRQKLDPDELPPDDTYKKQIDSYKEQIEVDRQKRESWAKQLKDNLGKNK